MSSVLISPRYNGRGSNVGGGVSAIAASTPAPTYANHVHSNLSLLDGLTFDVDAYLKVNNEKIKAGFADEAAHAAEATHAEEATHADEATHAAEADNADKWDGKHFDDYLDQSVKRDADVEHNSVKASAFKTKNYAPGGFAGAGTVVDGEKIEVENLVVRKSMTVTELLVSKVKAVIGKTVQTCASGKIQSVVDGGSYYKCFIETDGGTLPITFSNEDQVRCQRFDGRNVNYYWRRCTSVGADYINLSKSDCDTYSGAPAAGDEIVTMGNRTNPARQNFILTDGPALTIDLFKGCNTYDIAPFFKGRFGDLSDKGIADLGLIVNAGRFSNVVIGGGSSGLENLAEWSAKQTQINNAQAAATTALQSANTANNSISDQRNYVDGAFKDGVVSEAEAAAIDKLNKQINSEFDRAIADYNAVYTNTYLVGAAKSDLLNSKINLVSAKDTLQASINAAIADSKTTVAEKADVDSKFAVYKNAFTDYQGKLSNASKAVQVELDRLAGVKVDAVKIGGRNLIMQSLIVDNGTYYETNNITVYEGETYIYSGNCAFEAFHNGIGFVYQNPYTIPSGVTAIKVYTVRTVTLQNVKIKLEKGNKATDYTRSEEDVQADLDSAKAAAATALQSANAANSSISDQRNYIDGAFKDGVVSEAEAAAIDKLNKQINSEFDRAIADYNAVYTNTYLVGAAKSDLLNSKINLVSAKDTLQASINAAIADSKTTVAEKADVDSKFAVYKNAFTDYQTKLSNSSKAVQIELDRLAGVKVDGLQIGGRNLIRQSSILNATYYQTTPIPVEVGQTYIYSGNCDFEAFHNGIGFVYQNPYTIPTGVTTLACFAEKGSVAFADIRIKLEKGNKATDWTSAPEDIQAELDAAKTAAANAQADAITAKARTEGLSGVDGGLVFANLFKLMPVGATKETAGMSGQTVDANGNSLPAFFAGGSLPEAIAGVCNLILYHNANAKFGDFNIDSSGSICIKEGNVNRLIFTKNQISSLSQIFGSSTSGGISSQPELFNGAVSVTRQMQNSVLILNNNTVVTVVASITVTANGVDLAAVGNCTLALFLRNKNNGLQYFCDSVSVECNSSNESKSLNINKQFILPAGEYVLKVDYDGTTATGASLSGLVSTSTINYLYSATAQRSEFGRNGFLSIADYQNFIYAALESDGFKFMLRGTGNKIDMPGVLLAGKGLASGGFLSSRIWGSKSAGISIARQSVGYYRLYHYLGHSRYSAIATACSTYQGSALTAYISAETDTYIDITILQGSTPRDSDFNFNISGNNQ